MKHLLNIFMVAVLRLMKLIPLSPEQERSVQIIDSNFGREGGWYVERDGSRIAILSNPRDEDMFWVSYEIKPLVEDEEERRRLLESKDFWLTDFVYRSVQFDEIVEFAFPALDPFVSTGRLNMRGLYLLCASPGWRGEILLRHRQWQRNVE